MTFNLSFVFKRKGKILVEVEPALDLDFVEDGYEETYKEIQTTCVLFLSTEALSLLKVLLLMWFRPLEMEGSFDVN